MGIATRHPLPAALVGGLIIAWAGIFVRLADVSIATSATWRCLYALPALAALLIVERHGRAGPLDRRAASLAVVAGLAFGADLLLWHRSIQAVGAGLATVLANAQVAIVPLAAWLLLGERPGRRHLAALACVAPGCVLISGALDGAHAYGSEPALGAATGVLAACMYSLFLLALRAAAARTPSPVAPLAIATATSALVTGAWGVAKGTLAAPTWPAHWWLVLLALSCQVLAWLIITTSLVRLPAASVSLVLPIQPVGSLVLGMLIFAEHPAPTQWLGAALTLAGIVTVAGSATARTPELPRRTPPTR